MRRRLRRGPPPATRGAASRRGRRLARRRRRAARRRRAGRARAAATSGCATRDVADAGASSLDPAAASGGSCARRRALRRLIVAAGGCTAAQFALWIARVVADRTRRARRPPRSRLAARPGRCSCSRMVPLRCWTSWLQGCAGASTPAGCSSSGSWPARCGSSPTRSAIRARASCSAACSSRRPSSRWRSAADCWPCSRSIELVDGGRRPRGSAPAAGRTSRCSPALARAGRRARRGAITGGAQRWTAARLAMTHDLVERMVGHRTRLAQEPPRALARRRGPRRSSDYLSRSSGHGRDARRRSCWRWFRAAGSLLALVGLAPAFVSGRRQPRRSRSALGGVLLGALALRQKLSSGLAQLVGRGDRLEAGARRSSQAAAARAAALARSPMTRRATRRPARRPVARGARSWSSATATAASRCCAAARSRIAAGDRVLLEGPSGGGKSTLGLAARRPARARVRPAAARRPRPAHARARTAGGGASWPRRSSTRTTCSAGPSRSTCSWAAAGRRATPTSTRPRDLSRSSASATLLERMPAGLLQMVGESGWQLSHGERSRLFIARALLQGARRWWSSTRASPRSIPRPPHAPSMRAAARPDAAGHRPSLRPELRPPPPSR